MRLLWSPFRTKRRKLACCIVLVVVSIQAILLCWTVHELVYSESHSIENEENSHLKLRSDQSPPQDMSVLTNDFPTVASFFTDSPSSNVPKIDAQPDSNIVPTENTPQAVYWTGPEQLAEKSSVHPRTQTDYEKRGNNILFTIRTTKSFHEKRLPVLFDTWINKMNGSNIFLVTDGDDEYYQTKSKEHGIHYVKVACGTTYGRWSLCCKSGEEMSLMHKPENHRYDWFCHIDDDIYVILHNLVKLLSIYNPKNESVYIGRAGSYWKFPRKLSSKQTLIQNPNNDLRFHFAVGGLYCLSRPMLNKVKPWLGDGKTMGKSCDQLLEPEDVTVAAVVELLAHEHLSRTKLFHPHGLILSKVVNPTTLKQQVGFAYGCGQLCSYKAYNKNAIQVPNAFFPYNEDPSRFKSVHCHLYPDDSLCKR